MAAGYARIPVKGNKYGKRGGRYEQTREEDFRVARVEVHIVNKVDNYAQTVQAPVVKRV
jgi:hypothetical protein